MDIILWMHKDRAIGLYENMVEFCKSIGKAGMEYLTKLSNVIQDGKNVLNIEMEHNDRVVQE